MNGANKFNNGEAFNDYLALFLFVNSSEKEGNDRVYVPGNNGKNVSKGNVKVELRKVKK